MLPRLFKCLFAALTSVMFHYLRCLSFRFFFHFQNNCSCGHFKLLSTLLSFTHVMPGLFCCSFNARFLPSYEGFFTRQVVLESSCLPDCLFVSLFAILSVLLFAIFSVHLLFPSLSVPRICQVSLPFTLFIHPSVGPIF